MPQNISVPQNIPVLQNQNDIAFNQMSTHMGSPNQYQVSAAVGMNALSQDISKMTPRATESTEPDTDKTQKDTREYLEIGSKINGVDVTPGTRRTSSFKS